MAMNWKKKIMATVTVGAITAFAVGCGQVAQQTQQAPEKIAVIDYQACLSYHPDGPKVNESLNKAYEDFSKKAIELQKGESASSEENQKQMEELQKNLREQEQILSSSIRNNVNKQIDEIMAQDGYAAVYDRMGLIRGGHDITVEVLRKEGADEETIKDYQKHLDTESGQGNAEETH